MRQIGTLLGLGQTRDLPDGTIMGSDPLLTFGRDAEPVFPGDHDIVHGQYLFRPDANDIDFFEFQVQSDGLFTAQTLAERAESSSSLDTVLRLYRQTDDGPQLMAQNDDYFSEDSYLKSRLTPGTYYVGVSSTGNDQYDAVSGLGGGGTTEGDYELLLNFETSSSSSLVDATGRKLDGDGDGIEGGAFNFWFAQLLRTRCLLTRQPAAAETGRWRRRLTT